MSPLEELYLVLAAIYVADCLHWVRRDAQVLRARWRRFELQQGGALFGNDAFGLNLAWPLPPLGTLHVCDAPVLALGRAGVLGERLLPWGALAAIQAEGRALRGLARASSPRQAAAWAAELRALAQLAPAERERALERRERERYDTRAIVERAAAASAARARVLPWAQAQLALCFLLAPLSIECFGLVPVTPWLLAALAALQLAGLVAFARAHARLAPAERGERIGELAAIALSPPGLMRAADLFTRDLFVGRAALAVASVLLGRADFERAAGQALREARHAPPRPDGRSGEAQELFVEAGSRGLAALERFLAAQGLDPERLDAPPERLGEDCRAYCPRCQTQFVLESGACERCSGVVLAPFVLAREQRAEAAARDTRGP